MPMPHKPLRSPPASQGGFALIGTAIAVAVWMTAFYSMVQAYVAYMDQEGARISGAKIAKYNSAVAAFINGSLPNVPLGNYVGTAWLKDAATCPGATGAVAYLPCAFDDFVGMNLVGYNTTITQNNPPFYQAVTTVGAVLTDGRPDGGLGGAVVRAAESWIGLGSMRQQAEHQVGIPSYDINPNNAIITATIDTATNADPWLRRDGSNAMAANLNAGGFDVNNAQNMNANGNVRAGNGIWAGTDVSAGRNVGAGQSVFANTAGNGGDVAIANAGIAGQGPLSLAGSSQGTHIVITDQDAGAGNFYARVQKPICPLPLVAKIDGKFASLTDGGIASPIGAMLVRAINDTDPNYWRVFGEISTAANPTMHSPRDNRLSVSLYCQPS